MPPFARLRLVRFLIRALPGVLLTLGTAQAQSLVRRVDSGPEERAQNVLLIVIDDVGVDMFGAYAANYGMIQGGACTPNLDGFAANSVRFTNAWSSPVCSPTRAQILTGRTSRRIGLGHIVHWSVPERFGLQPGIPTLPQLMPGYSTAALGKWHLTDPILGALHPRDVVGFDSFRGALWNLDGPGSAHYNDWLKTELTPTGSQQTQSFHYATTDTTDDALALMATMPEPWFLYVSYHASHSPFHCPLDYGFDPLSCGSACSTNWCADCDPAGPLVAQYGAVPVAARAMTESLDTKVGEIFSAYDPGDTAVILVGDNGSTDQSTLDPFDPLHSKGTVYQGGINVPLLARVPGGVSGVNHELVSTTDLFATILEMAGFSPVGDPLVDSVSIVPYLDGTATGPLRDHVYAEFFEPNFRPDSAGNPPPGWTVGYHERAIRDERFKIVEHTRRSGRQIELFELASVAPQDPALGPDPFEVRNLMLETGTWTPDVAAAFTGLNNRLLNDYEVLPVPRDPPLVTKTAILTTDGTSINTVCDEARLDVGYSDDGTIQTYSRAFLEFDLSRVPANSKILEAVLELDVDTPAMLASSVIEVRRVNGDPSFPCGGLFHTIDASLVYGSASDWTALGPKSVTLSPEALLDIEAALTNGRITVGLKLGTEGTVQDFIGLSGGANVANRLRLTFTPY